MNVYNCEGGLTVTDDKILVGVVMGSASDKDIMKGCPELLHELKIGHEVKILSAHRTPELTREYAISAEERGIEVLIAGAGWAAHLAGVIAAHTTLPVIGVPIDSSAFQGLDALLSTVQMPPGIPVATVSVGSGGAKNAAILAAEILALKYPEIAGNVKEYRRKLTEKAAKNADRV
jgi:phosphoribosylaminoimidazole carboxylase PurE protein